MELSRERVAELFETSNNIREAAARSGVCHRTFEKIARSYGLYRRIGKSRNVKTPLQEILDGKHPGFPTQYLSKRLVAEGVKEYKCEACDINEWNGKPISLELDHIDGCSTNHALTNLRLLCPNCHSQTPTYRSKKLKWKVGRAADCTGFEHRRPEQTLGFVGSNPTPSSNEKGN